MGNDQACDTLGSDDIEEDIKVVPEIEFSPDCSEIKNEKEILDQSVSGNQYISFSFLLVNGKEDDVIVENANSRKGKIKSASWQTKFQKRSLTHLSLLYKAIYPVCISIMRK